MVVTSLGLPYEIYEMTSNITATRVIFFVINLALVLYLVITKRLFGVRGGKDAYEARLKGESILQAAIAAAAAGHAAGPAGSAPDGQARGEPDGLVPDGQAPGEPDGLVPDGQAPGEPDGLVPDGQAPGEPAELADLGRGERAGPGASR
jgi:hypothetical protein